MIVGTIHVLFLGYTAYLSLGDLGQLSETLHFIVFLSTTVLEVLNGLMHRKHIEHIMRNLGNGVYDYGDTLDNDSVNEIEKVTKEARMQKKFYSKVLVFAGTALTFRPLVTKFIVNEDKIKANQTDVFEGINKHLPAICWYPFDSRTTSLHILCFIFQEILVLQSIVTVIATDAAYLCLCEEMVIQLKIIGITVRNATKRAKKVMAITGEKYMKKSLSICLSHSVEHHITTLRLIETFGDYYFYLLLLLISGAAFLLCLSGILFTADQVSTTTKVTFFFFLLAEFPHAFIFCWYGEQIKGRSSLIGDELYDSDWINYSSEMKLYMLMILNKSVKPSGVSAGGFTDVSMVTFANVLSSAYSYFNLLNAVQ
ncbi:hypothetical protein O3M35_005541 [Rhynocoris fuscipes]|uniref:Odorant receptor n=1 Tax=Rhynocoris fuscipes TaxID=488301 RepID=A0AAW1DKI4_9HEMI